MGWLSFIILGLIAGVIAKLILPGRQGGGWFITPSVMAKAEYLKQTYFGYPVNNIKNGGNFNGLMLEGVIAF